MQLADLPSPTGLPIVGHLGALSSGRIYEVLERWAHDVGPRFVIRAPGRDVLCVGDGELARTILRSRPQDFARYRAMRDVIEELGVRGVFTAEGEAWRRQRRLVTAGLNSRAMLASFDAVAEITERLRAHWLATDGARVDVVEELMRYTIDVTGAVALGRDLDTLRRGPDVLRRHLEVLFPAVAARIATPVPYWRWGLRRRVDRKLDRSIEAVRAIVLEMVREARAALAAGDRSEGPRSLIEALILASDAEDPSAKLSDEDVYSNVVTILLAGEDTTANTTAWMLHYASQHPHVHARLRAEADAVLGEEPVLRSHEAARRLRYTMALMSEAGRLRPVGAVMFLEALVDQDLDGVHVPAGTPIFLMLRHIMRDPRYFGRPNELLPERWLDDERPAGLAHQPKLDVAFGGGPRICPGRPLALLEAAMVTSMVAKTFDVRATAVHVRERMSFTLGPRDLQLRFVAR